MRGKAIAELQHLFRAGITPACAGKSTQSSGIKPETRDHPRLCGEKFHQSEEVTGRMGSPPPVRGKVPDSFIRSSILRITPACAGKSLGSPGQHTGNQDHPRLCGEKRLPTRLLRMHKGSPPPVRGKVTEQQHWARLSKDHPRLCGEKWSG